MKRRICLITNWYPTKENPYAGLFFKEQAFATADTFDYLVIHYKEKRKLFPGQYFLKKLTNKHIIVSPINKERNTVEYDVSVYYPLYITLLNIFYKLYAKLLKKMSGKDLGRDVMPLYEERNREYLKEVFHRKLTEDFDVLYCIDAQSESRLLQCISEIKGIPYIVSEHAPFPWPGSTLSGSERTAIANADLFMAISYDKIRQVMMQNIKLKKIAYIGNMVDENRFALAHGQNEVKTFIIVAAHSFYKNYDLFFRVFNRLTEITDIPFKVMIVGYGANKGYSQKPETVEQKVKESLFAKYAELIPEISHDRIHELYQRADAFVMTSIQEGQPVSALEAGCCGLPIFSTTCGGVEDYVTQELGRLYKMEDYESFAEGLKDFLEGKIKFDSVRIREKIVNMYGKDAFGKSFSDQVNTVIDSYKNRSV